jgi:L-ascorbate metabolism protein UlaG (beta-lactamase superfamily)
MQVRWYGQSAFTLIGRSTTVTIDPFGVFPERPGRDLRWEYAPVPAHEPDLLLITHEHFDHNGAEAAGGSPHIVRSTAGRFETPVGEVVAVASEHDAQAGTLRGPNTIFVLDVDGVRVCHMGDFGQAALRAEQRDAIGEIDLLFVPVGGGPTLDAAGAAAVVDELRPALVVPMHYRTAAISFLDTADDFLARYEVNRTEAAFELPDPSRSNGAIVVAPDIPR